MKRFIISLSILVTVACSFLTASTAFAATNPLQNSCTGAAAASSICKSQGAAGSNPVTGPNGVLTKTTSIIAYIAGITAVIVMMVGGVMYVSSGGDTGKVNTARDMIVYSLVGLVVIVLARSIVVFIINRV